MSHRTLYLRALLYFDDEIVDNGFLGNTVTGYIVFVMETVCFVA